MCFDHGYNIMHSLIPFSHILCSILFYTFGMFDGQITVTVAKIGGQHIKYTCLIYVGSLTYMIAAR